MHNDLSKIVCRRDETTWVENKTEQTKKEKRKNAEIGGYTKLITELMMNFF